MTTPDDQLLSRALNAVWRLHPSYRIRGPGGMHAPYDYREGIDPVELRRFARTISDGQARRARNLGKKGIVRLRQYLADNPDATIADQPPPIPNGRVAVADLVIADMVERKRVGIERYGTPLQTHNGRDALTDLYQELLDACMYVRQAIEERDAPR